MKGSFDIIVLLYIIIALILSIILALISGWPLAAWNKGIQDMASNF